MDGDTGMDHRDAGDNEEFGNVSILHILYIYIGCKMVIVMISGLLCNVLFARHLMDLCALFYQ